MGTLAVTFDEALVEPFVESGHSSCSGSTGIGACVPRDPGAGMYILAPAPCSTFGPFATLFALGAQWSPICAPLLAPSAPAARHGQKGNAHAPNNKRG